MALTLGNDHSDVPSTQPPIGKQKKEIGRASVNYHPSVWGDRFAILTPHEIEVDEITKRRAEKLKHDVLKMLHNVSGSLQYPNLIDEIQRLGFGSHFETEIKNALNRIYNSRDNDDDDHLHAVALRFRLLRQHGYNVSSDVFKKFKYENGEFKASLRDNVRGLLTFYEAAYLGTPDDTILDEAIDFTSDQLKSVLPKLSSPLSELVKLALYLPLHNNIERLESRYFISIYQEEKERNEVLLEFAKLDFNVLQPLHKKELSQLSSCSLPNIKKMNTIASDSIAASFTGLRLKNKLSVLIVDDNRVNRKILMTMLSKLGVQEQEAENGQEAVNLHIEGARFDLILIDMEMPVMDGPQATRILRSTGVNCKMIGVSGNSRPSEKQLFMDAGINEYHLKPMTRAKLISVLEEIDAA